MSNLVQLTESYSIEEIEGLLRERKRMSTFDTNTLEAFPDKAARVIKRAHQCETGNTVPYLEEFYCDIMRSAYGQDYFDKLEALHGAAYHCGQLSKQTLKLVSDSDVDDITAEAEAWLKTHSGGMFSSTKSVARSAYKEALANKRGLTFFM
ncbi:hypothetical protein VPHK567_0194 [Vibrio phage K567]